MGKDIKIMERDNIENKGRLLEQNKWWICCEFEGLITAENYQKYLLDYVPNLIEQYGKFNLLFVCKNYKGWEKEAADLSLRSITTHGDYAERVAYIEPPESKIFQMKIMKDLVKGEVRFYDQEEYDKALAWIREESDE